MTHQQRQNEKAYRKCVNQSVEVIRNPKIVDTLAINGYIGGVVCQRTLDKQGVLTGAIERYDSIGEYGPREPGAMGLSEKFLIGTRFRPFFSEILGCGDCPYSETAPSPEVVELSETMVEVMSRKLTTPQPATQQ